MCTYECMCVCCVCMSLLHMSEILSEEYCGLFISLIDTDIPITHI